MEKTMDAKYDKHKENTWIMFLFIALFFYSAPYFLVFSTGFLISQTTKNIRLLYCVLGLVLLLIPLLGMSYAIPEDFKDINPQFFYGWIFAFEWSLVTGLYAGWVFGELLKPENNYRQMFLFSLIIIFITFGNSPLNTSERNLLIETALVKQKQEIQEKILKKYPNVNFDILEEKTEK